MNNNSLTAIDRMRQAAVRDGMQSTETMLLRESEGVQSAFESLQNLRAAIAREKVQALAAIDAKYAEELAMAESNYGILVKMTR